MQKIYKITSICMILFFLVLSMGILTPAATIEVATINPIIVLEKVNMEQAVAGSDFNLTLAVRNISNNPGFDLNMEFKVKDTDGLSPFTVKSGQTKIDQIKGNETRTVILTLSVDPKAQNKDYELLVTLTGKNMEQKQTVDVGTQITVPVTYDMTKPALMVKEVSINPDNPDLINGFDANITVENLSRTTDARNINVVLDGGDNFEVVDISNKKNIAKLEKGTFANIKYTLRAKDSKENNIVKLKTTFDYLGSSSETTEETINLPLPRESVSIGATPWVIINKYTLSDEKILAGNTVTLSLDIENTNQRPVKNVKISLGVIKIESTSSSGSSTTTGGTVFSPVNSSNSFYVESIPGKTALQKDVDLYVDPNAAAKTYIVPVTIKYEDFKGKTLECEELVNIPVTQECKLHIININVPKEGFIGKPLNVFAEFVNVGKVPLGNFMVAIEGDFNKENATYYVGNLDIGVNDVFQGSVIPDKEGPLEGMLVFSYIDNNNKEVREEHPFSMEIKNMPAPPEGMDKEAMMMEDGKVGINRVGGPNMVKESSFFTGKLLPIIMVLIILGEAIYIRRLKKKAKSEEYFDE